MPSRLARYARLVLVLTMTTAVLAATTSTASATSELLSLNQIHSANDDMDSTAVEWSGATYNPDTHVLLTVDDEDRAYEFQLDAEGLIDHTSTPRIIDLDVGRTDYEGVAWMYGQTYAFLSEDAGEVIIAEVPGGSGNAVTTVGTAQIERTFQAAPAGAATNLGPEGIATDGTAFYVTKEMPSTLTKFDLNGVFVASVDLHALADATGVAVLADGTYLVTSHESRGVAHYDIDWQAETAVQLAWRDAGAFTQLEGIALVGTTDVHLFGEDNTRKGNPGQTYSHLRGELVPPAYSEADINCSGDINIGDALLIARLQVGIVVDNTGCGSGDYNGDGLVDLVDALLIAQCDVGIETSCH